MSSSASPSASSAAATASSTPSSNNGFFSANGTPALILAFLAIGLFVGGMVTMFGLRRRGMLGMRSRFLGRRTDTWASDVPDDPIRQRTERRRQKHFGKKPELWDVYAAKQKYPDASWAHVMPISAKVITEDIPNASREVDLSPPPSSPPVSRLHSLIPQGRFGFLNRSSEAQPPAPPTQPARLEVAVAVAMPAQYPSDSGMLEYSLGLAQLPWDAELLADVLAAQQAHTHAAQEQT